ncbi:hypothetical protein JTE90_008628 [Oedothorax gibbosus]|uniref:Uncharacterized protein n=1 Tax=Oedothorax gibbosus TaxID=931172 RepID=A0AAV6U1K8_9ARAC|nr:hypothetical protein JTE90_008628 [Oedothorax gibbosus]
MKKQPREKAAQSIPKITSFCLAPIKTDTVSPISLTPIDATSENLKDNKADEQTKHENLKENNISKDTTSENCTDNDFNESVYENFKENIETSDTLAINLKDNSITSDCEQVLPMDSELVENFSRNFEPPDSTPLLVSARHLTAVLKYDARRQ